MKGRLKVDRATATSFRKDIFGTSVDFDLAPTHEASVLRGELEHYPDSATGTKAQLQIVDRISGGRTILAQNPSTHTELEDGFLASFGRYRVRFRFREGTLHTIEYETPPSPSPLRAAVTRMRSWQFTSGPETIGQRIHELVLVPSTFFDSERVPVHATALRTREGKAIALGGAGGVGKTTAEIQFCMQHNFGFIADDIVILDQRGIVYPNLAFPKIYAYNVHANSVLAKELFWDRPWLDRLHWAALHRARPGQLRRRISPARLANRVEFRAVPLSRYLILVKTAAQNMRIEPIPAALAARISVEILRTEYDVIFRHLHWHTANRLATGRAPWFEPEAILKSWQETYVQALRNTKCSLVKLPYDLPHQAYLDEVIPRIAELSA